MAGWSLRSRQLFQLPARLGVLPIDTTLTNDFSKITEAMKKVAGMLESTLQTLVSVASPSRLSH